MPLLYRNVSSKPCFVEGYPDVTILDAGGKVLAAASGAQNRGTFFDQPGVVPILMEPGLPAVGIDHSPLPQGLAWENVEWFDCALPAADHIAIDLPNGGGKLIAPYPIKAGYSAVCDGTPPGVARSGVFRGQLLPTGVQWPPSPSIISLNAVVHGPATVKRGSPLVYFVSLQNRSDQDYVLDPCPDYVELSAMKQAWASYRLNCAPVGHLAPGAAVTFEIRLAIPTAVTAGPNHIDWVLLDGRVGDAGVSMPITVTG